IGILITAIGVTPHLVGNDYYLGVLIFTALNCLTCIGLCLLMGYTGQISIGHAAFIAIGAYSSAILSTKFHWSPWTAMGCGVLIAGMTAVLVGIPTLRLKGHYLAMATLGFASIVHIVSVAAVDITGGPAGIVGIPRLRLFGFELNSDTRYYYFSWGFVVAGLYLALNLIHSRVGRALQAIHGSEDAASSLGVNISLDKIKIFILSAVYASVSGSLYSHYVLYIDPGPFDVMHSVLLVTMVAVGGLHNIWGALSGAVLLSLLPEFLSSMSEQLQAIGVQYKTDYDTLIYGGILLLIMLFLPEGLFVGLRRSAGLFSGLLGKYSGRSSEDVR
ncbi:MAG: branched-chain amino acid ABC transporter permease, partial [Thermodesulfobacteriota bacterium]